MNPGILLRGSTELLMVSIPVMRTAKPIMMFPAFLVRSVFPAKRISTPIIASSGAKELGFSMFIKKPVPLTDTSDSSQEVIVVPMLAPIITPTAW